MGTAFAVGARLPAEVSGAIDPLECAHFHGWDTDLGHPDRIEFVRSAVFESAEIFGVHAKIVVTEAGMKKLLQVLESGYFLPARHVGRLGLPEIGASRVDAWANDGYGVSKNLIEKAITSGQYTEEKYYEMRLPRANQLLSKDEREACLVELRRDVVAGVPGYEVACSKRLLLEHEAYKDMAIVINERVCRCLRTLKGIGYFYIERVELL